jgi:hypothetical protein
VKIQLLSQSTAAIRAAKNSAWRQGSAGCQRLKSQPASAGKTAITAQNRNAAIPASHHGMPPKTERLT